MFDEDLKHTKLVKTIEQDWRSSVYRIIYSEADDGEYNGIYLQAGNGYVLDIEDTKTLIKGLLNFVKTSTNEEIIEYNKENTKRLHDEMNKANENYSTDRIKFKKVPPEGYIYFVTTNNIEFKIGRAKDIKSRMGEYTHLPYEPILIHLIKSKDYIKTEELFHKKYKDKRLRGEWFKLTEDDVNYIKEGKYTKPIMKSIKGVYNHDKQH